MAETMNQMQRKVSRDWMDYTLSEISEEHYAAGWMVDHAEIMWRAIQTPDVPFRYGMGIVPADALSRIKQVSESLGEWFDGDDFVPLDQWKLMYEDWVRKNEPNNLTNQEKS